MVGHFSIFLGASGPVFEGSWRLQVRGTRKRGGPQKGASSNVRGPRFLLPQKQAPPFGCFLSFFGVSVFCFPLTRQKRCFFVAGVLIPAQFEDCRR